VVSVRVGVVEREEGRSVVLEGLRGDIAVVRLSVGVRECVARWGEQVGCGCVAVVVLCERCVCGWWLRRGGEERWMEECVGWVVVESDVRGFESERVIVEGVVTERMWTVRVDHGSVGRQREQASSGNLVVAVLVGSV